jgi:serine/threonine-protein kinase RsbW
VRLVIDLALPADASLLPKTRQAIGGYLESMVDEADTLHDVILALDEACANVIRHAFPSEQPGHFTVRAELDADQIRVLVEDGGVGLDPTRLEAAQCDDFEQESGRGLALIRALMTNVHVDLRPEGGTRLVMEKRVAG